MHVQAFCSLWEGYDSKELYKLGAEYYKNNEYIKALKSLRLVIENDNNYEAAKELELLLNDIVKDYISDEIITLCGNYEYEKAIKYANTGIELFPEDTQFVTKKEILEVEREEYYRTNQRLEIIYHNITSDWLHKILLEVIVFNNTNKVVREFTIGYMGYDKNGYPVKSGFLVNEFLVVGQATAANIQPMEKYGEGTVWDVYNTDVSKIKVCVKTVSYYDDSKWDNPYYDIWIDKYLNKPIK